MSRAGVRRLSRREELLERCQRERYELVAATATVKAMFPRARSVSRWIRVVLRALKSARAA